MTNKGFGYGLGYRTMLDPSAAGFYMPAGSFGWDGASGCYGLADPESNLAIVFAESSVPHHIHYTIPRVVAAMQADLNC
jgi:CubicO group peptidase (beta-lactamase class C family)